MRDLPACTGSLGSTGSWCWATASEAAWQSIARPPGRTPAQASSPNRHRLSWTRISGPASGLRNSSLPDPARGNACTNITATRPLRCCGPGSTPGCRTGLPHGGSTKHCRSAAVRCWPCMATAMNTVRDAIRNISPLGPACRARCTCWRIAAIFPIVNSRMRYLARSQHFWTRSVLQDNRCLRLQTVRFYRSRTGHEQHGPVRHEWAQKSRQCRLSGSYRHCRPSCRTGIARPPHTRRQLAGDAPVRSQDRDDSAAMQQHPDRQPQYGAAVQERPGLLWHSTPGQLTRKGSLATAPDYGHGQCRHAARVA